MNKIEGLDRLLGKLGGGLIEEALGGAAAGLESGLKRSVAAAKLLAPVGETGGLRNSITSTVERRADAVRGKLLATSAHAAPVELGRAAQPYLYPAWAMTRERVLFDAAKAMAKAIREG